MLLRLLKQQTQVYSGGSGVAVGMGDQATGQRQGVADGGAMVDLDRDVQRLAGSTPGLFRLALQPEDPRQNRQRGDALVVLHAKTVGEAVEVAALGQALDDLLGILPRLRLISGKVQRQYS